MENKDEKQFSAMDDEKFIEFLTDKFGKIDERFEKMDEDIGYLKNNMVTKPFLTEKLADLGGDYNLKIR